LRAVEWSGRWKYVTDERQRFLHFQPFNYQITGRRIDDPHQLALGRCFRSLTPLRCGHRSCGALLGPDPFDFKLPGDER